MYGFTFVFRGEVLICVVSVLSDAGLRSLSVSSDHLTQITDIHPSVFHKADDFVKDGWMRLDVTTVSWFGRSSHPSHVL